MSERRPNPERLLKMAQEEERIANRGKLKIYLGAAPGVGKTYTMLQDALNKREQGLEVVIGLVESHKRKEIEELVKKFEIIPRQKIPYHDKELEEFDLEGTLDRHPGLVLIDEMAHTNAPGLRHTKRWQDIKEVLDRGIDVYTTLNVQHIESLNDVVSQIVHKRIKETVPDSMLEMADIIELVDLPPEDLLKRLHEGKVYVSQQAQLAGENFFRKGNLIALRELALRATAERVGAQVLLYRQGEGIKHIWPTKDKILVCVGSSPEATKIIRAARRLATRLQAEWIAVHVNTPRLNLSEEQHNAAIQNLRLAEQLGAETRVLTGYDIVREVMDYAREQNITQIVVGKRIRSRWRDLIYTNLSDELVRHSGEIDVYIVTGESSYAKEPAPLRTIPPIPYRIYSIAVFIVAFATLFDFLLNDYLRDSNLIMVYLLGVTIVALFGRVGPSVLASVLSVLAYAFFFVPPFYTFAISNNQYFFTLLVMLSVSILISNLTIVARRQAVASNLAEHRTATLHTLSRQLASTRGIDKLLMTAVRYLGEVFDSEILALMPENGQLTIKAAFRTELTLNDKERGVAQWVYDLGQIAGCGTDTLPFSDSVYVPLITSQGTIGVLRIHPNNAKNLFTPEQMDSLEACANQIALAIEVDWLHEQSKKTEFQTEADRTRSALLQAVAHDVRTPLISVMGAATTLMELGGDLEGDKVKKLGKTIYLESEQLSRLINNILQITYLEAESVKLQKNYYSLKHVLEAVIKSASKKIGKKPIIINIPTDLPLIPFDQTLMQEVFINLIDNAIKFTPPDTPIEISATIFNDNAVIKVLDHGPGIMPDEVNKLFEKYYRGRKLTTERGLGLGLAICQKIIKVHGGEIWAENTPAGGASFSFTLPLAN